MTLTRHRYIPENSILLRWWVGFICVMSAGLAGAIYNVSVQKLTSAESVDPLPGLFVLMIRQWTVFFTAVPITVFKNEPVLEFGRYTKLVWTFLTLRSLSSMGKIALAIYAVQRIRLPDFATIGAVAPFLTMLISWPVLKTRPRITDFPLFIACVAGSAFIVRPDFLFNSSDPPNAIGCVLAFGAILCESIMFTTYACLKDIPIASVTTIHGFFTGWIATFFFLILNIRWPPCETHVRVETIFVGLLGSARIALDMIASKSLPPAFLALDPVSELIFQYFWEILINGVIPHPYSIIGACIIVAAFAFLILRTLLIHRLTKGVQLTAEEAKHVSLLTRICIT